MLKRTLYISSAMHLSTKDNQLILSPKEENGALRLVPIEDIGYIIIENQQTSITIPTLNSLSESNVAVVFCGRNFFNIFAHDYIKNSASFDF